MTKLNYESLSNVSGGIILIETEDKVSGEIIVISINPYKEVIRYPFKTNEELIIAYSKAIKLDMEVNSYTIDEAKYPMFVNSF